jgi:hypothetical protein
LLFPLLLQLLCRNLFCLVHTLDLVGFLLLSKQIIIDLEYTNRGGEPTRESVSTNPMTAVQGRPQRQNPVGREARTHRRNPPLQHCIVCKLLPVVCLQYKPVVQLRVRDPGVTIEFRGILGEVVNGRRVALVVFSRHGCENRRGIMVNVELMKIEGVMEMAAL